ncbi:MAG: 3-oxoacyl-ACP reductase [Chloroflexota bacterium]|nr:MAG: 3-oxoacyl-ACP reductase [Chloroflexota bacterium]
MSNPLTDKIALVTGAGRGIGRAISLALGGAGAHVVAAARTQVEIEAVAQEIEQAGGTASAWPVDLSSEAEIIALFDFIRQKFGRLDVLVNNAGMGLFGPLAEFASADLDRLYTINVRGVFLCCQQALRLMIPQAGGTIINISSVVGFKGYARQGGYTITKHALMGLTKTLALEAQPHGIRVSVISPGGVDTSMIGDARPDLDRSGLLQPEDIATTVLFLLSLSEQAAIDEIYIRRRGSAPF